MKFHEKVAIALTAGCVVLLIAVLLWPFATVSAGYVGVVTTFGKASTESYEPGIHFVLPFAQRMHRVYVGTSKQSSKVAGASRDLQRVMMDVSVNFNVLPNAAVSVYTNLGGDPWERVMDPALHDVVKATAARYEATDLIQKRDQVSSEIRDALLNRFRNIGVSVSAVNIVNFDFSKQFDDAIESKITAQQNALRVENEIAQTRWEAQKRIVESEAALKAAENTAKANELLGKSLGANPALVEKLKIEKWDGHYPQYMLGNAMPMIQMGK